VTSGSGTDEKDKVSRGKCDGLEKTGVHDL